MVRWRRIWCQLSSLLNISYIRILLSSACQISNGPFFRMQQNHNRMWARKMPFLFLNFEICRNKTRELQWSMVIIVLTLGQHNNCWHHIDTALGLSAESSVLGVFYRLSQARLIYANIFISWCRRLWKPRYEVYVVTWVRGLLHGAYDDAELSKEVM